MYRLLLPVAVVASAMAGSARLQAAVIVGPYTVDADTLHLYHFDEPSGLAEDAVSSSPIDLTVNGPTQGVASASGAGYDFNLALYYGTARSSKTAESPNDLTVDRFQGSSGAFTYEALVKLNTINADDFGEHGRQILSMDQIHTQFRIDNRGDSLRLFFFTNGAIPGGAAISSFLPTAGDDAVAINTWFHVAVAYDGTQTANLYWTKLRDDATEASLLTTSTAFADTPAFSSFGNFSVGNVKGAVLSSWPGMIDEVRISGIARGPEEFMFSPVPEPSTMTIFALGAICFVLPTFRRKWKKRHRPGDSCRA